MKINWSQALVEYISNDTLSYQKIAVKYNVSTRSVERKAKRDNWVQLRNETSVKVRQIFPNKIGETVAEFQARKLKVGMSMVTTGKKGIEEHPPQNFREAIECLEAGYKLATEALGLNHVQNQVNIQQNTITNLSDLIAYMKCMEEQKQKYE